MTTVGYGEGSLYGQTVLEQFFCVILMIFGLLFFSIISGSLSSMFESMDIQSAELDEKLMFLKTLKTQYALPQHIYKEINRVLELEHKMGVGSLTSFIEELPITLRSLVVESIHRDTFKQHSFFN